MSRNVSYFRSSGKSLARHSDNLIKDLHCWIDCGNSRQKHSEKMHENFDHSDRILVQFWLIQLPYKTILRKQGIIGVKKQNGQTQFSE